METLTEADDDHGKFAVMMVRESSSWNCCYMDRNERREVPRAAARWRARRHDVTTLPALANYHERPRRTLTTRRAGDRTGMLAESRSLGETAGRRLSVASRGSYDKGGYLGMGGTVWSVMAPLWVECRPPMHHPPLQLINSIEQTRTRPSHGKVLASLSYESLGVCFLVRRQTPVGHGVFMPCHERVAPARTSPMRVRQMVENSGDP